MVETTHTSELIEKKLITTEKVYHVNLKINGNNYCFIVNTINIESGDHFVVKIKRGITYYDCGLRLKTSEKKFVKRTINNIF